MTILANEIHEDEDIVTHFEALSYTNDTERDLVVLCTVVLGSPSQPLVGGGLYQLRAFVDDNEILPTSNVSVAAQAGITLQSRELSLQQGQEVRVTVRGVAGDTSIDVVAVLIDVTPATVNDLFGDGAVAVDHDYGGADSLKITTPEGAGIQDVNIVAYLAADYAAGDRGAAFVRGRTTTNVQGQWRSPISLDQATYTLVLSKPDAFETRTYTLVVS